MYDHKEYMKQYNQRPTTKKKKRAIERDVYLRRVYGITEDEFNEMFERQEGCCAICKTHQVELKTSLHVDHCHETQEIRGLLCASCNLGLGMFKDTPEYLLEAISYLRKGN